MWGRQSTNAAGEQVPPIRWYEEQIRAVCHRTGIADPECAKMLAPIVRQGDIAGEGSAAIGRRARAKGKPMTGADKKSAGINTRMKISREAFGFLTVTGRTDPVRAYEALAHWPLHQRHRPRHERTIRNLGAGARIHIIDDDRTCEAARDLAGKFVAADRLPDFPLPGCDQWMCRCGYYAELPPRRKRKRYRLVLLAVGLVALALAFA